MEELVSIVIPIYNVEQYLEECIKSVIMQTYTTLQIILVDDGSTDNSGEIADNFVKEDKRIQVIHKKNGGLSDARNYGIELATGKYITFIDSDDYVENTYIEKLYNAIKKNNTKVSQCNISKVNNQNEVIEEIGYNVNEVKNTKKMLKEIYSQHWIENTVVWNKMYLTELFKDIRYPIGKIHEDEFITYKILYNVKEIALVNEHLYNYRENVNSITRRKFTLSKLDILEAFEERLEFFKKNNEQQLHELTLIEYAKILIDYYIKCNEDLKLFGKQELLNKYRKIYVKLIKIKEYSKIRKLKCTIDYISPLLYYNIKKIIRK